MKIHISNFLALLPLVIALCMITINANGQYFTTASFSGIAQSSGSAGISNTGNSTNGVVSVNVWDGSAPGIGWTSTVNSGFLALNYSNAYDPDVCLVKNGAGDLFAIVVYTVGGQGYMETFKWTGSPYGFGPLGNSTVTSISGITSTPSAINVDGLTSGDFVIVWDDGVNTFYQCGNSPSSNNPLLTTTMQLTPNVIMPDVCMYNDQSEIVHFTFIDPLTGEVYIDDESFSDLNSSNVTYNVTYRASPIGSSFNYSYPRIACPAPASGREYDYTVAVEANGGGKSEIVSVNNATSSSSQSFTVATYTDGSTNAVTTINGVSNLRPVVAYDGNAASNGNVFIGWTMDNSAPTYTGNGFRSSQYPIVVKANYDATFSGSTYYEVPTSFGVLSSLSIAGGGTNNLYTWCDASDVYYKEVAQSLNHLRYASVNPTANKDVALMLQDRIKLQLPADIKNYQILLTDVQGRTLFETSGDITFLDDAFNSVLKKISEGIYLVRINSLSGSYKSQQKLVKL